MGNVAVLGATGFIGTAVIDRLRAVDRPFFTVPAPRLHWAGPLPRSLGRESPTLGRREVSELAAKLAGAEVVINAAGMAVADAPPSSALFGANAVLPLLVAKAAAVAGVRRLIHVSSISVQANQRLDESSRTAPFSAYSLSRALGEQFLLNEGDIDAVIYRPAGIHGPQQSNTKAIVRIARSPLACVAGDGSNPTPQALVEETADALVFIGGLPGELPRILLHPPNGMTTGALLRLLGEREPRHLPYRATRMAVAGLVRCTRANIRAHSQARRLEMLLCGRDQAATWLAANGFAPTIDIAAWRRLAATISRHSGSPPRAGFGAGR